MRIPDKWVNPETAPKFNKGCLLDFDEMIKKYGDVMTSTLPASTEQLLLANKIPRPSSPGLVSGLFQTLINLGYRYGIFASPQNCPWGTHWGNLITIKTSCIEHLVVDSISILNFSAKHAGAGILANRENRTIHTEERCAISFVFSFSGKPVRLVFTHLEVWDPLHKVAYEQLREILDFLGHHSDEKKIIGGEFCSVKDQIIFGDLNSLCRNAYTGDETTILANNNLGYPLENRFAPVDNLILNNFNISTKGVKMEVWANRCVTHFARRNSGTDKESKVFVWYSKITDHALVGYSV